MIKTKKSLGQNFFTNPNLAKKIIDTVLEHPTDIIVEIGPGQGYFSSLFKEKGVLKNIVMIEKDDLLALNLKHLFPEYIVVNQDFLDWDFEELKKYSSENITFFGSLPYNVSKKIIEKIVQSEYFKTTAFFIIQKEVAEKYIAQPPENNLLATRTNIYSKAKKILDITPDSFKPKPKVMSSLISFTPEEKQYEKLKKKEVRKDFDLFLQNAYKQPRKKLSNNLKNYLFNKEEKKIATILDRRPQHISLDDFFYLFSNISEV